MEQSNQLQGHNKTEMAKHGIHTERIEWWMRRGMSDMHFLELAYSVYEMNQGTQLTDNDSSIV